jgi:hypothetical protein
VCRVLPAGAQPPQHLPPVARATHGLQPGLTGRNADSPQVLRGLEYSGRKVDIWSCGVVLYTMASGNYP